jgi:mannose-6-phosphate isomerase-like protein (cupin superfamily)|tara:strand:+ start:3360 stop:3968 length:609 start_codon:yes stop_codon:yes gene_type:complete
MNQDAIFQTLLRTMQSAYSTNTEMMGFAPFPNDIIRQDVIPYHCNCSAYFQSDIRLISKNYSELQNAISTASKLVHWRETYKGSDIGNYFMDRFGCYCILGENAPFSSDVLRLFMVYMPSGLYYPWHHHPAEEMYMVVSGGAIFKQSDCPDKLLSEGEVAFHASNQPHAMETTEDPVLCLVAWRDNFQTPPVLTPNTKFSVR